MVVPGAEAIICWDFAEAFWTSVATLLDICKPSPPQTEGGQDLIAEEGELEREGE